jgi:hypothetical protein
VAALALCSPALAIQEFKKQFDAKYVEGNEKLAAAVAVAKCNVCHDYKSKSKKDRNEYGMALSKFLKKENFKMDRIKEEPDKVKAEIWDAFKKVEDQKSTTGKSFGDLIKAGELPGGKVE